MEGGGVTETAPPPTNQRQARRTLEDQAFWDDYHEIYIEQFAAREDVKPEDVPRLAAKAARESFAERRCEVMLHPAMRPKRKTRKAKPKARRRK